MPKEKGEIWLRVSEVKQSKDVGRGRVRIDKEAMNLLGVEPGDIVEIQGRKRTAAVVWPGYPEDTGSNIIRMDHLTRRNAGTSIGEKVVVKKAKVKPAAMIKLAPTSTALFLDENFIDYIKKRLIDHPLCEGDIVQVSVLGQPIPFAVVSVKPKGIIIITENTRVLVLNRPVDIGRIPRVSYEDIGDLEEAKQKIREMIELPLKHPELFKRLGIEPPKGILLHGPPGCGKTLLAKAVATESGAHFIAINGPEIMSKFYGESEARLREVFKEAQENAPATVSYTHLTLPTILLV